MHRELVSYPNLDDAMKEHLDIIYNQSMFLSMTQVELGLTTSAAESCRSSFSSVNEQKGDSGRSGEKSVIFTKSL